MAMKNKERLQKNNAELRECIGLIEVGVVSVKEKDVNFYDYDGTLLHSYTVEEAQALSELPELPTQKGLICQGWNWTLDDIKAHNRAVDVGATYITDDGKTRLYIKIEDALLVDTSLYFSQTVANGVTIDWGDGSATETLSGTSNVNTTHTYASIGEYVITLDPADGCKVQLGINNSNNQTMFGKLSEGYVNKLRRVEIGKLVTKLETYTFCNSYELTSVVIPKGVTSIWHRAFAFCHSLTSIILPEGSSTTNGTIFQECIKLKKVVIPNGITGLGQQEYADCISLTSIILPDSVTNMGNSTFQNCYLLRNIVIPKGVTAMNASLAHSKSLLSVVILSQSLKTIGAACFGYCYNLSKIVIPKNVIEIKSEAFRDCISLVSIDFSQHESVPTLGSTNAFYNTGSLREIRVPAALVDEWKAATNWSTLADYIVGV